MDDSLNSSSIGVVNNSNENGGGGDGEPETERLQKMGPLPRKVEPGSSKSKFHDCIKKEDWKRLKKVTEKIQIRLLQKETDPSKGKRGRDRRITIAVAGGGQGKREWKRKEW